MFQSGSKVRKKLEYESTELTNWAYNYMMKELFDKKVHYILDTNVEITNYSVIEIFDMWEGDENEKKLFLINFWKAFYQKKSRLKSAGKVKEYNYRMNLDIKDKMDELSEWMDRPKNLIVQRLINEAYKKMLEDKKNSN